MDETISRSKHTCLTFDEANIVYMVIKGANPQTCSIAKLKFHDLLDKARRHTTDSCLRCSIDSLEQKIRYLSQAEFEQLCRDVATQKVLFPENYQLPSLTP